MADNLSNIARIRGLVGVLVLGICHPSVAQFTDVTASAGLSNLSGVYAVSWGDYNNDGYPDLFVTINGSTGTLFVNNGNGTFSTGPSIGAGGRAAVWGDYDNDGDLDLLRALDGFLYQNNGNGTFTALNGASIGFSGLTNMGSPGWLDYDEDGYLDIWTPDGTSPGNHIYENDGDGTFTDQGADALGLTPSSNGETTVVTDFDGDGHTDILYRGTSVVLWRSDGDGTFTNITSSAGISLTGTSGGYNGTVFGDYDNDGDLDFYGAQGGSNKLYRNNGNLTFTDVASSAGVQAGSATSRGVAWGDYDNDGDLDLYVAHSNATNHLFRNNNDGTFTDVAASLSVNDGGTGYGVTFADYDLDGDLDIFLANDSSGSKLYRNDLNDGNYLKVKVTGSGSGGAPADGAGSRVELWNAANTVLLASREITGGEGYGSQRPHIVHFGVTPSQTYVVKVKLTSAITITRGGVVPQSESITVGATTLSNTINIVESAGVSILASGGSTDVNEAGPTSDTYTIVLNVAPAASVTIAVDPDAQTNLGAGSGTAINLTFTVGNWNVTQTVTVTATDDLIAEGSHTSTITHTATSSDGNYNGVSITNVTANVTDNDTAGVTVTQSGGSTDISEAGPTSDTYTIVLDTEPTASVTVTVDPDVDSDVGAGAGTATILTFTTGNWNTVQTVTVTAVDDGLVEGAHSSTITHTAASTDSFYNAISINNTVANVTDNDTATVIIVESGGSTDVTEGSTTSDTYTLVLSAQPTANVTLSVDPDPQANVGAGAGNAIALTFTTANWNTPQTVTVTAYDDAVYESSHTATIAHSTTSSDVNFHGLSIGSVTANVTDNDSPPPSGGGGGGGASSNDPVAPDQNLIVDEDLTLEITLGSAQE